MSARKPRRRRRPEPTPEPQGPVTVHTCGAVPPRVQVALQVAQVFGRAAPNLSMFGVEVPNSAPDPSKAETAAVAAAFSTITRYLMGEVFHDPPPAWAVHRVVSGRPDEGPSPEPAKIHG